MHNTPKRIACQVFMLDQFRNLISDKVPTPNKFSIEMGRLIKTAREEANWTQAELGERVHRRQATISDLETGKSLADTSTIAFIAAALDKPIIYFFPFFAKVELKEEELIEVDQELLLQFRRIWNKDHQQIAISMVRGLAEFSTEKDLEEMRRERQQAKDE